jgi:hypothetical protein
MMLLGTPCPVFQKKSSHWGVAMNEHNCPDCDGIMQPIKLIDATYGTGWDRKGGRHIELGYAAPDATPSVFSGKIKQMGVVKGLICTECARMVLYGEKTQYG